jgi:hypothetical protein
MAFNSCVHPVPCCLPTALQILETSRLIGRITLVQSGDLMLCYRVVAGDGDISARFVHQRRMGGFREITLMLSVIVGSYTILGLIPSRVLKVPGLLHLLKEEDELFSCRSEEDAQVSVLNPVFVGSNEQ